ncbi:hypothetical protein EYF80_030471 [Liparis tanakae]|uniref:Uncharacterized protein n=1 Tax=Liparis tanakae TaxID=230148 RepID=A0A4Z2H387_9TELE|nr:hypothetical protein EYF80_030471 [Liparis tanakae]
MSRQRIRDFDLPKVSLKGELFNSVSCQEYASGGDSPVRAALTNEYGSTPQWSTIHHAEGNTPRGEVAPCHGWYPPNHRPPPTLQVLIVLIAWGTSRERDIGSRNKAQQSAAHSLLARASRWKTHKRN